MSDGLTCTGLPSVSALSPPYGEGAPAAAPDADNDPDELVQARIPDDARGHVPDSAQHPNDHPGRSWIRRIGRKCSSDRSWTRRRWRDVTPRRRLPRPDQICRRASA